MNIDVRPRLCGKSFMMVQLSDANQAPIVCPTRRDAERLMATAKSHGYHIPEPVTVEDLASGRLQGLGVREALVDDADRVLALLLRTPSIMKATWTERPFSGIGSPTW
jgi:hypothetical protein